MKTRLPEKNLNESLSSCTEESFSKITFRKRGHNKRIDKLSDIGEEDGISSNASDFDPTERTYQSNWVDNDTKQPVIKKKRKKKKVQNEHDEDCANVNEYNKQTEAVIEPNYTTTNNPNENKKKNKKKNKSEHLLENQRNEDQQESIVELGVGSELDEQRYSESTGTSDSPKGRKKKKKQHISEEPLYEDQQEPIVELGVGSESNKQYYSESTTESPKGGKKKKKKHISEEPLYEDQQEPIVELGVGSESNKQYCSESTTESPKGGKKKKKKHISEEPSHSLNLGPAGFKSMKMDDEVALRAEEPEESLLSHKKKKSLLSHSYVEIEDRIDSPLLKKKKKSMKMNDEVALRAEEPEESLLSHKKKKSLLSHSYVEIEDRIDSPLLKKKNKTKKLMDNSGNENTQEDKRYSENGSVETGDNLIKLISSPKMKHKGLKLLDDSYLGMQNNENLYNDKIDVENNEVYNNLNISAKKLKKKHEHLVNESLINEKDSNKIDSQDNEGIPVESSKNKQSVTIAHLEPECFVLPKIKFEDSEQFQKNNKLEKKRKKHENSLENNPVIENIVLPNRDNNLPGETESGRIKSLSSNLKEIKFEKNKKNKISKKNNALEENPRSVCFESVKSQSCNSMSDFNGIKSKHENKILEALEIKNITSDTLPKKKKNKNNIESLRNQLLKEALSGTEKSEDCIPKSTKLKTGIVESSKTHNESFLKEGSFLKKVDDFPPDQSKLRVKESVGTIRKRLLNEAISNAQEIKDLPPKSNKLITAGANENVDKLRKRLLQEAFYIPKCTKVHTRKSRKLNNDVKKDTSKKKHKKKLKSKSNEIDLLTQKLISKALEKVSSSSTSHSSQENINILNAETKNSSNKKQGTLEIKTGSVKKLKSNLLKHTTTDTQDARSKQKTEIAKMQQALLNNALKNINPGIKSLKKLKKKSVLNTYTATEKCVPETYLKV